jgi:glycosyltransferase involved in cell wall biosynthesis
VEKISIIVPIYKVEPYIHKCIKSICSQTYENLEILLIDDGSPDKCGEICDKFAAKDSRIRVFHIENSGQSHARNVGLNAATGDYIGFVDGDDWICDDMYEKLLEQEISHKAGIAECNFHGRKQKLTDEIPDGKIIAMTGKEAIIRQLDSRTASRFPSTSVWSKLFRSDIIQNLRFPDGKIHEEYAFLCEAFLNAEKYIYINECLYERTLRNDSTTAEKFSGRSLDKLYVYQIRNEVLAKRGEEELLKLSKEQEYELLLHYVAQAKDAGLVEEEEFITGQIAEKKKEIIKSRLPLKKKLQYQIYFINKNLYYRLRKG